jgi:hypothetical protein
MRSLSLAAAALLACAVAAPLSAQTARTNPVVTTGPASLAEAPAHRVEAFESWRASLPEDGSRRSVLSADTVRRSSAPRDAALAGAVLGGMGGMSLGYIFASACESMCPDPGRATLESGLVGVVAGGAVGYLLGKAYEAVHRP